MTATPPPVAPLTSKELAALRAEHECCSCSHELHDPRVCNRCGYEWPCTVARLLSNVSALQTTVDGGIRLLDSLGMLEVDDDDH